METKRNLKYYTSPLISVPSLIGWGIVALGVLLYIITVDLWLIGIFVAIAGVLVVAVASGGKSTDSDIEYQISERIKNLQEKSEKKFEVYEKSFLKMLKPIDLRGYDFEASDEPFYYRKGQDGVHRTNYFKGVNIIFTSEKMYIYLRRFSLIDEAIDAEEATTYHYKELDKAEVVEKEYTYEQKGRKVTVKYYVFNIYKTDGTPVLSLCVDYGADIDKYAELISRAIVTRQKELVKREEEAIQRRAEFRAKVEAEKAAIARGEMDADEGAAGL